MPKVTLLTHTPLPEKTIAAAAKLCYSASTIDDIGEKLTDESATKFVDMLADLGHASPIEHAVFTFGIEDVSRALLAQITRHRMASFSVQSQRYVKANNFEFVTPPEIAENPVAEKEFKKAMENSIQSYRNLTDILFAKYYEENTAAGMNEKLAKNAAEKKAIEDARFVLPNAATTKMVVTMNARSLINFFNLRCCNRAQWEIREVANLMLAEVCKISPSLFKNAGPSCIAEKCPEGRMSCGRMTEVREYYNKIKNRGI